MTRAELRAKLRRFLRDYPELNELLDKQESSDELFDDAIDYIIEDFNQTVPITNYSVENFPSPEKLVLGAAAHVLESAMIHYARNRVNISDGGVSLMYKDKAGEYSGIVNMLKSQYFQWKSSYKKGLNLESFYGKVR